MTNYLCTKFFFMI